ncbi:type II CAAX prenyl endopeptidase Rce1 family protein [Novosphingobium sp.]|uniref:CPBP family glutamic-type intramembrane protease n=1 Tax=Novosphingobium sp. TaxID=1874826 RepID=UPI003B51DECB
MIRTVLADFRAWLAMPRLITPTPLRTGWRTWGVMLGLYLCGLVVIGAVLAVWQRTMHVPAPEAFRGFSGPVLAVAVVLAAPIGEESLFRGWLTGRPRALWLLAMAIIAGLMLIAVQRHWHDTAASLGFVATLIAALVGWLVLRRRTEPLRWFAHGFAVWFALSVAVFALAHMANYPRLSWVVVPMVMPQLWAGLVFGYLRMRHGLIAAILAHACGNAAALAMALTVSH